MANREPGFYWVKDAKGRWLICEYSELGWFYREWYCVDENWVEIDERRIERPADPERVFYDHKPEGAK